MRWSLLGAVLGVCVVAGAIVEHMRPFGTEYFERECCRLAELVYGIATKN